MGYNREIFVRIKAEYLEKYLKARASADCRAQEVYLKNPRIKEIDRVLSRTPLEIMSAITSGREASEDALKTVQARNEELNTEREALLKACGYPANYTDVQYECSLCDDSGYVDGRMCECMRRSLVLAGYESSGLGRLISKQSFDNFSLDYYSDSEAIYENMKRNYNLLRAFAESFSEDNGKSFLLIGGTGLGKTHISTAIAKSVIDKGFDVFYVSAIDMFSDFERKQFGNVDRNTERYFDCDLLIIDDLGTELTNQFIVSCLYNVINSRINTAKSTIINTNLSKKEIELKYSERITSRLFGEYYPLLFAGTDIRQQKIQ